MSKYLERAKNLLEETNDPTNDAEAIHVLTAIAQTEALVSIAANLKKLADCVGIDSKYGGLLSIINWKDMP